MAADLASTPITGLNTVLCGDTHLANFDLFASPERGVVFDVKDFDETYPGPPKWNLKRLAASAVDDRVREVRVSADKGLTGVILSMEGVDFIDVEGADVLAKITQDGQEIGIDYYLARVKPQVMRILQRDGVVELIGADHIHDDIAAAVRMHLRQHPWMREFVTVQLGCSIVKSESYQ